MAEILSMETTMEEREELMVPQKGGNPTRRVAHFLMPTVSPWEDLPLFPPFSTPDMSQLKNTPSSIQTRGLPLLEVHFKGWRPPQKKWKTWIDQLKPRYQHIWKQAGIYEAILASTYKIKRDKNMIVELTGRWCTDTNTFIFPWGEATVTLEDVMALGGYSVLGGSILNPVNCNEFIKIEADLGEVHKSLRKSYVRHYSWMDHFMGSGKLEHEAFLALWLSRYVFPIKYDTVESKFFPLAINLSRGVRLALAPAVLSSIYRDLSLLKKSIIDLSNSSTCKTITLWAPFQLVQLWAWERFPALAPQPQTINFGELRPARWDSLRKLKAKDVQNVLDSTGESFEWCPYGKFLNDWCFSKFCRETGGWIFIESSTNEEVESVVRCLRVSELLGLDCIEQYLPHRVALQFGMDQDVPRFIHRLNDTPESAWNSYSRPVRDRKLYIPAQLFEPAVTYRYLEWWKKKEFMMAREVLTNDLERGHKDNGERLSQVVWGNQEDEHFSITHGAPSNFNRVDTSGSVGVPQSTNTKAWGQKRMDNVLMKELPANDGHLSSAAAHSGALKESSVTLMEVGIQNRTLMERQKRAMEDAQLVSTKRLATSSNKSATESSTSFNLIRMDGLPLNAYMVGNESVYKI